MKEPFLEPILRQMRLRKVLPVIRNYADCHLLDIGCGWDCRLLKSVEPFIKEGVGIDFKVKTSESSRIKTMQMTITDSLPFEAESFDVVTMLAVLEHISRPLNVLLEIERVLKSDGQLVLTVPSRIAKPVLEFLSYRLHIVNSDEIRDHKQYYKYKDLQNLFSGTNMTIQTHKYFQMGMNNLCIVKKLD